MKNLPSLSAGALLLAISSRYRRVLRVQSRASGGARDDRL